MAYRIENKFGLSLSFIPEFGTYNLKYNGESWLGPGIFSVYDMGRWYMSQRQLSTKSMYDPTLECFKDEELFISNITQGIDNDILGENEFISVQWGICNTGIEIVTGFRMYKDNPYIMFFQKFPRGFKNYANGNWRMPSVIFPQFRTNDYEGRTDLYSWSSGGMFSHKAAYGSASTIGGTVDVLMLSDTQYNSMIISPYSNYLSATQQSGPFPGSNTMSNAYINCGIQGLAEEIPEGYEHSHIIAVGKGINNTFKKWGEALLFRSGKPIPSKYKDITLKYLTYWDDYGSYYCQNGFKETGFASYEDIIIGLEKDARENGLNIGAYQVLDLDQLRYTEAIFEPRVDLFPHGLKWLTEKLQKPLMAYITWHYPNGPYREKYHFFQCDERGYIPTYGMGDVFYSREYWDYTADKLKTWGCIFLQHDFLNVYEGDRVMMAGVNNMEEYFKNLAKAMYDSNITMQYCMQLTRNILESTENHTMISLQGTWDHHAHKTKTANVEANDNYTWKHLLFMNTLYGSLGIWPARDNVQPLADPNGYEDILLSNLTAGPVELGHRIGESFPELLRKTFREGDGLLLKPDRPITPIDRCYIEGGVIGYTESDICQTKWYYVLSLPSSGFCPEFTCHDLYASGLHVVYNYRTGNAAVRNECEPVRLCREAKHEYFIVAPVLPNGMAVIGDTDKFVTMADKRIDSVTADNCTVSIKVFSNESWNPIITGYSPIIPEIVKCRDNLLEYTYSLELLKRMKSGWTWDSITKLWFVKMDFSDTGEMTSRGFTIGK